MADSVKVTFLGGLGEIGRNCACIEVDGSIILLDCGLMFPDLEMLGIDLVLPDFSYLHENADRIVGCIVTHGHEDHVGGLAFLLRELSFPIYGSALTLGLASNRIGEAGLARSHRVDPGARRRAAADRADRCRVHPRHPLGAARLRHRVPHAAGRDPALGRLEARPHPGRRSAHRSRLASAPSPTTTASGCCCPTPRTPRSTATRSRSRPSGRCSTTCSTSTRASASSRRASPRTSTACSRSPTPPSPSAARSPPWACRCGRTCGWPARWACCTSPMPSCATSTTSPTSIRPRCA